MGGSESSHGAIVVGCLVGVVASAMQSIGLTLQRKSHMLEDGIQNARPLWKRGIWRLGLLLFLVANIFGSSVQIGTLPLIILSPLQAIGLVFNSIFAALMLDEPFSHTSVIGTLAVGLGAFLIAFFGAIPEPRHSLDDLLVLLHRPPFIIWMALTLSLCLAILMLSLSQRKNEHYYSEVTKTPTSEEERRDEAALTDERSVVESVEARTAFSWYNFNVSQGILYGVVSGVLSAHSLLMAKSAVEICIRGYSTGFEDFRRYQTWLIVGSFIMFAVSQLYVLNLGLAICSTTVLYPLVFCVYNVTNILNGLVYFNQASLMTANQILWVFLGTVLVLLGVLALSWRSVEEENKDIEERSHLIVSGGEQETSQRLESGNYTSFSYGATTANDPGSPFTEAATKSSRLSGTHHHSQPT